MTKIGYALLSELFPPSQLITQARAAQESGFSYLTISDHFHPWIDKQGNSPYVWSMIGALSQAVKGMEIGTAVTCPLIRYHPAIVAQAAATTSILLNEKFFLGLGTGENLNEHIVGFGWPNIQVRRLMLDEAVSIIRTLWEGTLKSYYGVYYVIEDTKIYNIPSKPPPIIMAASGIQSAKMAGKIADGIMSVGPNPQIIREFEQSGGSGKPKYGQLTVCYANSEEKAIETALSRWPNAGVPGQASSELALPSYFEEVSQLVSKEKIEVNVVCGPDASKHIDAIKRFWDAGFDHVHVANVGTDEEGFFKLYRETVLPAFKAS